MSHPPDDGQDAHMFEDLWYDKGVCGQLSQECHCQGNKLHNILRRKTVNLPLQISLSCSEICFFALAQVHIGNMLMQWHSLSQLKQKQGLPYKTGSNVQAASPVLANQSNTLNQTHHCLLSITPCTKQNQYTCTTSWTSSL